MTQNDEKNKEEYLKGFKWIWRIGNIAYFQNPKNFSTIEIDPGGGCMESRFPERWFHLGFGLYKIQCPRNQNYLWLDNEEDFDKFNVRAWL